MFRFLACLVLNLCILYHWLSIVGLIRGSMYTTQNNICENKDLFHITLVKIPLVVSR